MPHLQELQEQFQGKLQVITVSTESPARIEKFLASRPTNLLFAVLETDSVLRKLFPYRILPHAVLLGPDGRVAAITEPRHIDGAAIRKVLARQPVHLPLKQDNLVEDPMQAYFAVADTVRQRLLIQPQIPGLGGSSRRHLNDPVFRGRRLTVFNLPLESIYRIAYGDLPHGRAEDQTGGENGQQHQTMYCLDLIVPKGQEHTLLPTLRRELAERFGVKAGLEKRRKAVYVLRVADPEKVSGLKKSAATEEKLTARSGAFSGEGVRLGSVGEYLESFGIVKQPVVDETGVATRFDLSLTFEQERPESLTEALRQLGLKLAQAEREIEVLVFR